MTTKDAVFESVVSLSTLVGALTHTNSRSWKGSAYEVMPLLPLDAAEYPTTDIIDTSITSGGLNDAAYGLDFIFERIWLFPKDIAAKLITATDNYTITIWNAYLKEKQVFSAVSSLTPDGTSISTDTLPHTLQPMGEAEATITIFKVGPSIQQTSYYFTIGGVLYEVHITGLRVIALAKLFNWVNETSIIYKYETSVFQSERLKEQRRSVRDIPLRTLNGEYLVQSTYGQQILNMVQYGHDKLFAVPIVDETLIPTVITTGGKSITLSNSTSDKWNFLNLCQYIGIYQPSLNQVEVHEVASYTANTITTVANIVNTYDVNDVSIMPIFFASIQNAEISNETNDLSKIAIQYQEKKVSI